jgi:hypothetical protein
VGTLLASKKLSVALLAATIFGGTLQGISFAHAEDYVAASETGNIREDRHDSPDSPSKVTGSIEKMPLMGKALRAANPITGTILYHAPAPVMISPKVYSLWYGTWSSPCGDTSSTTTPGILNNLLTGIGSSAWYGINTQYYQNISGKQYVTNTVTSAGCASIPATMGTTLDGGTFTLTGSAPTSSTTLTVSDIAKISVGESVSGSGIRNRTLVTAVVNATQITISNPTTAAISNGAITFSNPTTEMVVAKAIASGVFSNSTTPDANGIYFIFTSSNVAVNGFLTTYCGYHGYSDLLAPRFKYSFIGDPGSTAGCIPQSVSPHGNAAGDAMANVTAHELVEAVSDPELNAWFDSRGNENADKCNFVFGTTTPESNSSSSNVSIGSSRYLIQQNWSPVSNGCFSALPPPPPPVSATVTVPSKQLMVGQTVAAFTPVTASSGTAPYTYLLLPSVAGLRINTTTGQITSSGTLVATPGVVVETVTITDSLGSSISKTFNLQISPALTLTTTYGTSGNSLPLTKGTQNISQTVVTAGGSAYAGYTYALQGNLPSGLIFDTTTGLLKGNVSSAPLAATSYTVRVTDGAGFSATRAFFLKIV